MHATAMHRSSSPRAPPMHYRSWRMPCAPHQVRCYVGDNEQRWYMWYSGASQPSSDDSGAAASTAAPPGLSGVAPGAGSVGVAVSSDGVIWKRGHGAVEGSRGAARASDVGMCLTPVGVDFWWTLDTCHLAVSDVQVHGPISFWGLGCRCHVCKPSNPWRVYRSLVHCLLVVYRSKMGIHHPSAISRLHAAYVPMHKVILLLSTRHPLAPCKCSHASLSRSFPTAASARGRASTGCSTRGETLHLWTCPPGCQGQSRARP